VRISYRVDHGVRVMTRLVELSAAAPGRPVTRARLAEKDALPPGFLDDILRSLRTGGLVRSQRGGGGGWSLARPPASITVAHVIRAVEGPLSVVRGVRPHELPAEGDPEPFVSLWIAVRASLRSVLEAVTIADLAAGTLPPRIAALAADPDAWDPHGTGG
jgi:Rrf2 family protein